MKMKSIKLLRALLFISIVLTSKLNGQSSIAGNIGNGLDFLGHSNNFPQVLATTNFTRMIINNGPGGQNFGRIGMGNDLTGFVPIDRLHLHQVGPNNVNNYLRFTNPFTGPTNTDGFRIGNSSVNNPNGPQGDARLEQYEQAPILMLAPNSNTNSPNLLPYEWFRLQNGQTFPLPVSGRSIDGFIYGYCNQLIFVTCLSASNRNEENEKGNLYNRNFLQIV